MKIKTNNTPPNHGESLCDTCTHMLKREGMGINQTEVMCTYNELSGRINYPIAKCSCYDDIRIVKPQMFWSTAWILVPKHGFVAPTEVQRRLHSGKLKYADVYKGQNDSE